MMRKWSARLLALGGLSIALGCKSTPAPVVTTPLLPEAGVPCPPPGPLSSGPSPFPTTVTASPGKPWIVPQGAHLPKPGDLTPPILPGTNIAGLPNTKPVELGPAIAGPDLPAIVPPRDVAPLLAPPSRPAEVLKDSAVLPSPRPAIKPVEQPRPPAGLDGFAPAPIIPPPSPDETQPPPMSTTRPAAATLPIKAGDRFGHSPEYKWIVGVLDRNAKGGYWTLRYADYSSDDEWGGKMRLLDDPRLNDFKDGDQVYIEGELLAPRAAASAEGVSYPPYRINEVRRVDKVK